MRPPSRPRPPPPRPARPPPPAAAGKKEGSTWRGNGVGVSAWCAGRCRDDVTRRRDARRGRRDAHTRPCVRPHRRGLLKWRWGGRDEGVVGRGPRFGQTCGQNSRTVVAAHKESCAPGTAGTRRRGRSCSPRPLQGERSGVATVRCPPSSRRVTRSPLHSIRLPLETCYTRYARKVTQRRSGARTLRTHTTALHTTPCISHRGTHP